MCGYVNVVFMHLKPVTSSREYHESYDGDVTEQDSYTVFV
jgi:hypothetical protein